MSFDINKWNKQRYLAEAGLLESTADQTATVISKAIETVDENLSYKDFSVLISPALEPFSTKLKRYWANAPLSLHHKALPSLQNKSNIPKYSPFTFLTKLSISFSNSKPSFYYKKH